MRREFATLLIAFLPVPLAAAQQPVAPSVYYAGPGVTAPELLPAKLIHAASGHCNKFDRTELVSAVVDATGAPRDVSLIHPAGTDLDKIATNIATADRFKPASYNGAPVSASISIELKIYSCIEANTNESGQRVYSLQLRTLPDQKVDLQQPPSNNGAPAIAGIPPASGGASSAPYHVNHDVTAPVLVRSVEAELSERAREEKISGICLISLIVDAHGMPQDVHVTRSLEPTLDESAVEAVRQYRFKPALHHGTPVPVLITIEVNFDIY
jgi:TonB family protein